MTGVFLKLSEILRYLDGDTNLDNLIKGEPFYYDQSLFCDAIISRTKENIKFLCLMDRDEPTQRGAPPNPVEVSGSLNISSTGEFFIDEFKCLNCNVNKCRHVAAHLMFMNRHNINKFERFKPKEVAKARKLVISARYNARPLSEIFKTQHDCQCDSDEDDEYEDIDEEEEGTDEELHQPTEEERRRYLEAFIAAAPNSLLAQVIRPGLVGKVNQEERKLHPQSSPGASSGATSKATTPKSETSKTAIKKKSKK